MQVSKLEWFLHYIYLPSTRGRYWVPWSNCISTNTMSVGNRTKSDCGAVIMYLLDDWSPDWLLTNMLSLSLNIDTIIILGDLNVNEVKYVKERNSKERSMISVLRIALHGIKVNNLDPDSIFVLRLFCCITLLSFQNTIKKVLLK